MTVARAFADLPWRVVCWLTGHKTLALGPSPPEGWWCWRCYQAVHTGHQPRKES